MAGRERLLFKIPTKNPQPPAAAAFWHVAAGGAVAAASDAVAGLSVAAPPGAGQGADGITVYPPRPGGSRWRAVTEGRLAAKLEPVAQRLAAQAPNMLRSGAELIACYLSPDRLPVDRQWSRRHAETQRYLCARFVAPVIRELACQDISVPHRK